jgi:Tfp pilus assembly protein PilN
VIAINLLPGARRKRGAKGAAFKMPDLKALATVVKDPWLLASVGVWAALALIVVLFWLPGRKAVETGQQEDQAAQRQLDNVAEVERRRVEAEARRDTLLGQIGVISAIDRDRFVWPHILNEVTRSLPQSTWFDELSSRPAEGDSGQVTVVFQISGKSADIQAITRFVRTLEESPFVQNVTLSSTGQTTEQGFELHTFALSGRYQQPPPSLITEQPLAASLVQGYRSGVARPRR